MLTTLLDIQVLRAAVVNEAKEWVLTPYQHEARVKKVGCDCATLLAEVFERAGVFPHVDLPYYPMDWHFHNDEQKYLNFVEKYADEIPGPPQPGDIVLYQFGQRAVPVFAHGGIVVEWPLIIHSARKAKIVCYANALIDGELAGRNHKFFSWAEKVQRAAR